MEECNKKIYELALNGEKIKDIAIKLNLSETFILNRLKDLENKDNPNYNPSLAFKIMMKKNISNPIDKDELDEIVKMIFDGLMLIEIAFKKNITVKDINKLLSTYTIKTNPYYNPNLYTKINQKLAKTMNLDDLTLFKRLRDLERLGANLNNYPKIAIVKRYESLKRCYQMMEDFLNDNYESLRQLHTKYHLSTDTLAIIIREEDNVKFLATCVDPITKEKILLKYQKRKLEMEHPTIEYQNKDEDKDKLYLVYKNLNFWILFMIHFKLSIYDIASLLNIKNTKKLYNVFFERVQELDSKYVNAFGYINEKINSENVLEAKRFYQKYSLMKKVNKEQALKMLDILKDKDFNTLVKSKKKIKDMSREERLIICNYWLKYAMPIYKLPYSENDLNTYCKPLIEDQLNNIIEYNKETNIIYQRNLYRKNK